MSPARRPMVGAIIAVVALVSVRLVSHGRAWSPQLTPDLGAPGGAFVAVAATSPTNAWAVGHYSNGSELRTLIEHWDGSAWTVQPSPNLVKLPGRTFNSLFAVAATSSTSAWAVGYYDDHAVRRALIEHWDGSAWSVQRAPDVGLGDQLQGVAATSPTDAWAVGSYSSV